MSDESKLALEKEEQRAGIQEITKDVAIALLKDLGVGSQHVEGKNLRTEGESFYKKLNENIDKLISDWSQTIITEIPKWNIFNVSKDGKVTATGNIFIITQNDVTEQLELEVNFHPGIVTLIKEIRNLRWLNMLNKLDNRIGNAALAAIEIHPFAVSLIESIKTFNNATSKVYSTEGIAQLLASNINEVHNSLTEGFKLSWGHPKLEKYSRDLSDVVLSYQEKSSELSVKNEQIIGTLESLKTCPLREESFHEILSKIQKLVDDLNLASYSNLKAWVSSLDKKVESALVERLKEMLNLWISEFVNLGKWEDDSLKYASSSAEVLHTEGKQLKELEKKQHLDLIRSLNMDPYEVSIVLSNRTMLIEPPIERARVHWLGRLHSCIGWICDLPRVQSSRFDTAFGVGSQASQGPTTYRNLLALLPQGLLKRSYDEIEGKIIAAAAYVQNWLQYQGNFIFIDW